jgi:hypothetical protein
MKRAPTAPSVRARTADDARLCAYSGDLASRFLGVRRWRNMPPILTREARQQPGVLPLVTFQNATTRACSPPRVCAEIAAPFRRDCTARALCPAKAPYRTQVAAGHSMTSSARSNLVGCSTARVRPEQNLVNKVGGAPQQVRVVCSIGHQTSRSDVFPHTMHRRQSRMKALFCALGTPARFSARANFVLSER